MVAVVTAVLLITFLFACKKERGNQTNKINKASKS